MVAWNTAIGTLSQLMAMSYRLRQARAGPIEAWSGSLAVWSRVVSVLLPEARLRRIRWARGQA